MKHSPLCLTAAALALFAAAAPSQPQDSFTFKRTYKAGDKDLYQTVFTIDNGGGQPIKVTILVSELVKDVAADGKAVVATTMEAGKVEMGEDAQPVPGVGQTVTTTYDKDGKVVARDGQAPGQGMLSLLTSSTVRGVPDRPLKMGETTKVDIPLSDDKKQKLAGSVTLEGREPKSDDVPVETFKVKGTADGTVKSKDTGDQKVHLEVVSYVEPDTGKLLKTEGKVTGLKVPDIGEAVVTFKRVRMVPGADTKPGSGGAAPAQTGTAAPAK